MVNKLGQYIDFVVQALLTRGDLVKVYVIPILVFILDFSLRLFIGVDVSDVGADMALLATAAFISMVADEHGKSNNRTLAIVVFQIMFMLPWVFCLWSVSRTNPLFFIKVGTEVVDIHVVFSFRSWFVG